jgi:UDP-N-acetylmuramyl pentapeptide synthase
MYAALAALAVGKVLNIPFEKSAAALRTHDSPPGRMNVLRGIHDSVIIDDPYNSSPVAAVEALETLRLISSDRKIAVLGDMMELGTYSRVEHEKLGKKATTIATDIFIVGTRAKGIAAAALRAGFPAAHMFECADSLEAGEKLRHYIQPGDIVLLKGSQSVRMERAVALILAEPEKASELLVRQEPEWKR